MEDLWQWLLGIGITVSIAIHGAFARVFWNIMRRIDKVNERVGQVDDKAAASDKELHGRISRVREDTAHRSDLTEMSARLSKELHEIREEQRKANTATNTRLDALLSAIANRNDRRTE